MTDFLTRLAERTLGVAPTVQPVLAPLFAPSIVVTEEWVTPDTGLAQNENDTLSNTQSINSLERAEKAQNTPTKEVLCGFPQTQSVSLPIAHGVLPQQPLTNEPGHALPITQEAVTSPTLSITHTDLMTLSRPAALHSASSSPETTLLPTQDLPRQDTLQQDLPTTIQQGVPTQDAMQEIMQQDVVQRITSIQGVRQQNVPTQDLRQQDVLQKNVPMQGVVNSDPYGPLKAASPVPQDGMAAKVTASSSLVTTPQEAGASPWPLAAPSSQFHPVDTSHATHRFNASLSAEQVESVTTQAISQNARQEQTNDVHVSTSEDLHQNDSSKGTALVTQETGMPLEQEAAATSPTLSVTHTGLMTLSRPAALHPASASPETTLQPAQDLPRQDTLQQDLPTAMQQGVSTQNAMQEIVPTQNIMQQDGMATKVVASSSPVTATQEAGASPWPLAAPSSRLHQADTSHAAHRFNASLSTEQVESVTTQAISQNVRQGQASDVHVRTNEGLQKNDTSKGPALVTQETGMPLEQVDMAERAEQHNVAENGQTALVSTKQLKEPRFTTQPLQSESERLVSEQDDYPAKSVETDRERDRPQPDRSRHRHASNGSLLPALHLTSPHTLPDSQQDHTLSRNTQAAVPAQATPGIHVTIGRIEVRAVMPAAPPTRPTPPQPAAGLSLDAFLEQYKGRKR